MKLFKINDSLEDVTKKVSNKKKPVIQSRVANAGVAYGVLGPTQSRTSFQVAEYNLGEISKVMDIESYVRQAFNKHVELCLKEGYDINSRDVNATLYIKKRLREIAEASGLTFDMLLRSIIQNLVAYSNAFLVKVRDYKKSSGRPIQRMSAPTLPPVAAYFPMDPTSIRVKRDFHGKVLKYWQRVPGNPIMPQFIPENVVHIYYDKKEGFSFGTPYIVPVLDDIRSLRRMEENVEMLINQHLFPLYHYQVGTESSPAEIYEDGTTEVDVIKEQIERMPTEGSIVTPERHTISNLGAEGKAIDAENYLKYFEKRVLAGLGVSDVALGRGDTSNRATASTLDKVMTDRCKDFQDVVENFINEYILKELLFEGGFAIDEKEDNFVKLKFREIDIDSMLKVQNHSIFKFEHNATTEDEMRNEISRDPLTEPERDKMFMNLVSIPLAKVQAEIKQTQTDTNNRNKPTNQHGTKSAKTSQKKDYEEMCAGIDSAWHILKNDIIDMVNSMDDWKSINLEKMKPIVDMNFNTINENFKDKNIDFSKFEDGMMDIFNDLGDVLCKNIKDTDVHGDLVFKISGIFESLRFRLFDLSEKVII